MSPIHTTPGTSKRKPIGRESVGPQAGTAEGEDSQGEDYKAQQEGDDSPSRCVLGDSRISLSQESCGKHPYQEYDREDSRDHCDHDTSNRQSRRTATQPRIEPKQPEYSNEQPKRPICHIEHIDRSHICECTFMIKQGIDPLSPVGFDFPYYAVDETILSINSFKTRYMFTVDDDALTMIVDDKLSVVAVTRNRASEMRW